MSEVAITMDYRYPVGRGGLGNTEWPWFCIFHVRQHRI